MELEFRRKGCELVAKINCTSGKKTLKGGGVGWFEVAFVDWRFDWKLRVQASITELKPGHAYNDPHVIELDPETTEAFLKMIPEHLRPSEDSTRPTARRDIVEVVFRIPDCIHPFRGGGWGCTKGGRIKLGSGRHHCQARVEAKAPNPKNAIRRTKAGIEFVETELGQPRVIGHLNDCDSDGELLEQLRKPRS